MNSFGNLFKVSLFGESHGKIVGVLIDGCPAGVELSVEDFLIDLERRRSGAKGTTKRTETDFPNIKTGLLNGFTTGAPIYIEFENKDTKSEDYSNLTKHPRPGHADFTSQTKFGGFNDYRGGGRFSGRLTVGLVAAGAIAKKIISPVNITSEIIEIGGVKNNFDLVIDQAIKDNDSLGGIIKCTAINIPAGIGEPFFNSVESLISHIVFSIPAVRGIEFGAGFYHSKLKGSESNDCIIEKDGKTSTNYCGGINGGIANGNNIEFNTCIKATSSIGQIQKTFNFTTEKIESLIIEGRHDVCITLRVPPVLEAATAIVIADLMMIENKIHKVTKN